MSSSKSHDLEAVYSALLRQPSAHEKAIRKDIQRTFPSHSYFQRGGVGEGNLFNVLKAYSLYDPDVGYTQGIGFIVAAFLLNMPDEEAFCVLVRLMQSVSRRLDSTRVRSETTELSDPPPPLSLFPPPQHSSLVFFLVDSTISAPNSYPRCLDYNSDCSNSTDFSKNSFRSYTGTLSESASNPPSSHNGS